MSTDALREALELKIDELLDEFVAELDRKTFEDYAQKRNTYSSRIAALATPVSEMERLPLRILLQDIVDHFRGDFDDAVGEALYGHAGYEIAPGGQYLDRWLARAEAALKADRQGE